MKALIYQYWDGKILEGVKAGSDAMKKYADRIGVDYLFEDNPRYRRDLGKYSPHYGQFKILEPQFDEYDKILFADTDVFPVEGLEENIFEQYDCEIGICTEPFQPKHRLTSSVGGICNANDERWAKILRIVLRIEDIPRTEDNLPKVYNSGVVLYSRAGIEKAKERFIPFKEYVKMMEGRGMPTFYTCDQPYLHAMLQYCDFDWVEMDNNWNCYVHYVGPAGLDGKRKVNDTRTPDTKFVHIQLSAADHFDADKLWRITNLPEKDWKL